MSKLRSYQEQVQEVLAKSLKTLEEQHRAVDAKAFSYAENIEAQARSYSVKDLRAKHDKALDTIYSSVTNFNDKANTLVQDLIAKFDGKEKEVKKEFNEEVKEFKGKATSANNKARKSVKRNADRASQKVEETIESV